MSLILARIFGSIFLVGAVLALWKVFRLFLSESGERRKGEEGEDKAKRPEGELVVRSSSSRDVPLRPMRFSPSEQIPRWLSRLRWVFITSCLIVLGAHAYWAFFASGLGDGSYARIKRVQDQRNRRMEEIGLRGWVFDRRKPSRGSAAGAASPGQGERPVREEETVLAGYRLKGDSIVRHYPLGEDAAHLLGYNTIVRGSAGVELAYDAILHPKRGRLSELWKASLVGDDLMLTIDSRLQRSASHQLGQTGKAGAAVVLSVRSGDVLALASSPSFDPLAVEEDSSWERLSSDPSQRLVNRALRRYYLPGSTFKVIVAACALENGLGGLKFTCSREGYRPGGSSRPIYDDRGPSEAHGVIGLEEALRVSCNQYFAQLGVALGPHRLAETAKRFGFRVEAAPESWREQRYDEEVWDNKERNFRRIFNPNVSRLVLSDKVGIYDLALESYGQGYVQVTPLQMALVAEAIANAEGQMMAPRLDFLSKPRVLNAPLSAGSARRLRELMATVTGRPGGTAYAAFAPLLRLGIAAGGKTGTAQFETAQGTRVDSWFIGFAPLDDPQIAYAVVIEGGGYGGAVAAPVAAAIVSDAVRFGIIRRGQKP